MKEVRFTVAQVTALCGGSLPHANGFTWERVEYFLLEGGALQPYADRDILPGPGLIPRFDHWDDFAHQLREYMGQLTNERLNDLYRKFYTEGWAEPRSLPLSTRHADHELKNLLMKYVSIEIVERRESQVPSAT